MPTVKKYQQQKEKEQVAYQYFINQGYSPEASAGIVGNLVYESGLNTKAEGDIGYQGGSSFGIAQFRGQRLKNLKNRYGDKWTDFNNQLDFVRHELETTHQNAGNRLKNTNDVYEAGQVFSDLYEIPAKKYKNNPERQKKVNSVYNSWSGQKYQNTSPTPISDAAIQNVNTYFDSLPTTDVKDLEIVADNSNLAEETQEEEVTEDKDIEEVKKQTNEINFLQAYKDIVDQQQSPQETAQTEQPIQQYEPQQSLTDIYNQVSSFVDSPIAQQGTVVRDNIPNLQPKIINESNTLSPQNYLESYLQTPVYLDRLKRQQYPQPEEVAKYRLSRLRDVDTYYQNPDDNFLQETYRALRGFEDRNGLGSAYSPKNNKITINQTEDSRNISRSNFSANPKSIEAHELSHAIQSGVALNNNDERELFTRLKDYQVDEDFRQQDKNDMVKNKIYNQLGHDFLPSENKADIDALRYELYRKNIYDTRKDGKFNKWHLNQIRDSDFIKNRLKNNYKDEDIIWLMNNIADNSDTNNIYGQQGGTIQQSQDFTRNWYQNRVLPDPLLNETYQREKPKYVEQSMYLPSPKYVDRIDDNGTQGLYNPESNEVSLLNGTNNLTYTHEIGHKINEPLLNTESSFNNFQYVDQNITPRENIQNQWVKDNYSELSNYREIVPRLNAYRQYYDLKPDQVITPKLIQENRSKYLSGETPYEDNTDQLYKLFEDANLADTLNKVVYTGDNGNTYAQQGLLIGNPLPNIFPATKTDIRKPSDIVKVKSSLNEGEVNYVRTTRPSDKAIKREKPVERQASEDFINWYSDPATKEKFTKNTGLDANRLQDFIGKGMRTPMREAEEAKDIEYLSKLGADAVYQSPYVKKANNDELNSKTGEILYQKQRESTSYSKAPNMRNVLSHEIIHGSSLDGVLGGALQRTLGDVNNQQKGTFKRDREYLSHPEETYGNFHMFRKNLGLTPGQKIDERELKKLVKEKGLDEEIFYKAYDDDKIVKAINTIADNSQNNTTYAQQGGIPVSSNGVYDYPGQNVIVPTTSGQITMKNVSYPILGIDEFGNEQMMYPNQEYKFAGKTITEIPQLTENEKEFLKYISNG